MWQYWWPHVVYHVTRWFPRNNRIKIRVVLLLFSAAVLFPEFFVLSRPHTERFCGQPLFSLLIVTIIFTFCMLGFAFLFSIMEPVPWEVKLAFHIFGIVSFVFGLVVTGFTAQAEQCRVYTQELYYFSLSVMIISLLAIAFFMVMIPFWIINRVWKRSVLDVSMRTGLCYEPVKCCSCLWHI